MSLDPDTEALADRLFAAIGAGEAEVVGECLAPDVVVWTNFDGREARRDEVLALLGWMAAHLDGYRYDVVRREPISGGFLQQHVLRGRGPGGEVAMPACLVATVAGGRVTRMEEYTDPSPLVVALGGDGG